MSENTGFGLPPWLTGFFTSGVAPSAANAAGLPDWNAPENDGMLYGPPRPPTMPSQPGAGAVGGQMVSGLRALSGLAQQQQRPQGMPAAQPQIHRGNPQALQAFTTNLLQRRAALMPRVPGLLGGRDG
jgi:hypothetical protein